MRSYVRHLPHWRQEGVTYFVTFRLADSLPQSRLRELDAMRAQWDEAVLRLPGNDALLRQASDVEDPHTLQVDARHRPPRDEAVLRLPGNEAVLRQSGYRQMMERVERWLDEGYGSCLLREPFAADCLERKLRHFDGEQYDLDAFVLMPNHVHLLVKPCSDRVHPLERLEQAWKAYSSREINLARGTQGSLWQQESFDRIVRDEEHLFRCIQYIGSNPRRAGLSPSETRRWIRPDWAAAGWSFADP
jgi:putative transposase